MTSSTNKKLENIYHKGQDNIWNGKAVLHELVTQHGPPDFSNADREAIYNIFTIILWGELAAWEVSSQLAADLPSIEARMAATSQAHDEARHFYVMRDYLALLNRGSGELRPKAKKFLTSILRAPKIENKLLGMQLMVEPLALTLFKLIRHKKVDPVLNGLLPLYERDEARHVGLGVQYFPELLNRMSWFTKIKMVIWQFKEYMLQFSMLHELEADLLQLGIEPYKAFELARTKQFKAMKETSQQLGRATPAFALLLGVIDFKAEYQFSKRPLVDRIFYAFRKAKEKSMTV